MFYIGMLCWPVVAALLASLLCRVIREGKASQPPVGRFVRVNGVWYPRAHVDAMGVRRDAPDGGEVRVD